MPDWIPLGGALEQGASVASWGTFESEIFAIHEDGQVWNRYWDGKAWHQWEPMGGDFTGTPAASARDADRIDVLAIGQDGRVRQRYWDGKEWLPWRILAGSPEGALAVACSWVGQELRVFVVGPDRSVWYATLA